MAHPGKAKTADGLSSYRSKRDFKRTREPPGGETVGADLGRFVIQEHHARRLHWDLRLERDGVLVCWAIPKGLPESPGENHFAARTEEHPLEYLDFEGVIPQGQYGAGTMKVWDRGTYECLKWEPRRRRRKSLQARGRPPRNEKARGRRPSGKWLTPGRPRRPTA